ncbi:MAG: pentapeptide repeat-containing protein, partial [Myxococcales bacterium]|nr:pentapeptide repeat-containing protein [Myxococcales bacterium]
RYFYKSLKWVRRIELRAEHALGYWEREDGYHDNADPWPGDERYITGNLTPAQLDRFKGLTDFSPWWTKTVRRADLRGWIPATPHLGSLRLKGCDLRGARLAGMDLRGANLSLSDLRGADLEGAFFAGADLRQADLRDCLLTATTFVDAAAAAAVDGADLRGAQGLLGAQRAWLQEKVSPLFDSE